MPLRLALAEHLAAGALGTVVVHLEDGGEDRLGLADLLRLDGFPDLELAALDACRGRVLDLGAGVGVHALELQERGHDVVAVDVCSEAVEIMRRKGVRDARIGDGFEPSGETFDTILLMMNGLGTVGDLNGLDRFLTGIGEQLRPGGQILADSADLRSSPERHEPRRIAARREAGRYHGEARWRLEYGGRLGGELRWLFVDPLTLEAHVSRHGFRLDVVLSEPDGRYLALIQAR
jgi:SAM-dependent methyltransferase